MSRRLLIGVISFALIAAACGGGGGGVTGTLSGQRWVPQIVDFLSDAGRSPSIAVDSDGLPHLAYLGLNQKLKKGEIPPARPLTLPMIPAMLTADLTKDGVWTHGDVIATENVAKPLPLKATDDVALAVDDQGNRHVAFTEKGVLRYASESGGEFGSPRKIVTASGLTGLSVDVASDGTPWVSWLQGSAVKAATRAGKAWTVATVATVSGSTAPPARTSIKAGSAAAPILAYTDAGGGGPMLARRSGGGWKTEAIDPAGGGGYGISVALDADGNPHVAYYTADGLVRHAHSIGGTPWEISTIGHSRSDHPNEGWSASIALDGSGVHYIAWYDSRADRVRLATNSEGNFRQLTITGTEGGELPQVGVAPDGSNVYVAWYDHVNADLNMGTYYVKGTPTVALVGIPETPGVTQTTPPAATCAALGTTVQVVAQGIQFDKDCLAAPANTPFEILFDNKDPGTPHNVDVYDSQGGDHLFGASGITDTITGPAKASYKVSPQKAGTYFFQCDVHANMTGTFVVK